MLDRFIPALTKIARENDGKTVAVFSHGAALRMVLGTLEGRPLSELGNTPHGDNTAISLVEYDEDGFTVLYRDDNHHLIDANLSTFAKQRWWKAAYSCCPRRSPGWAGLAGTVCSPPGGA